MTARKCRKSWQKRYQKIFPHTHTYSHSRIFYSAYTYYICACAYEILTVTLAANLFVSSVFMASAPLKRLSSHSALIRRKEKWKLLATRKLKTGNHLLQHRNHNGASVAFLWHFLCVWHCCALYDILSIFPALSCAGASVRVAHIQTYLCTEIFFTVWLSDETFTL